MISAQMACIVATMSGLSSTQAHRSFMAARESASAQVTPCCPPACPVEQGTCGTSKSVNLEKMIVRAVQRIPAGKIALITPGVFDLALGPGSPNGFGSFRCDVIRGNWNRWLCRHTQRRRCRKNVEWMSRGKTHVRTKTGGQSRHNRHSLRGTR